MRETLPLELTEDRWRRLEAMFHAVLDLHRIIARNTSIA